MSKSILPFQDCDVHMRNLLRVQNAPVTILCGRFIRSKAFNCPPVTQFRLNDLSMSYNPTLHWLVESIHGAPCNSPAAALWLLCDQNYPSEQDLSADRLCNLPTIPPEVKDFAENNRMWWEYGWTLLELWDDLKGHLIDILFTKNTWGSLHSNIASYILLSGIHTILALSVVWMWLVRFLN